MVSSINSVRVWTQQIALKAFNEALSEKDSGTSSSSLGSLADMLYASSDHDDEDDTALSSLITRLQQQAMTGGAEAADEIGGSVEDISSDAFMKALQQKIDALATSPDTKAMAEAMQAALEAGTLIVTDVVAGEQISGRDVSDKKDSTDKTASSDRPSFADKTTAAEETETSQDITAVETSDWSAYLRDHLKRDPYGKYVRSDNGSHIDKVSGASSYFGMIGDTYYYLSWTTPKPAPDVTIQI
ncbi:hypothetical protein N7E02_22310 [Aliirhizobium terrae]|uniref:hypothetical protein n=1 Tax=Terrirhizobium terrae TaxID=2926709 RepID=UPI0025750EA3|nr:hypothetical protein [Rhizobium sp. CC-CFT758]WJH39511.1 hypothetical protein N7E02_22310 [Rhizobium sp. CC-CFT758]